MTRVLIAGASTRAAAASAVSAGFEVVSLDGFADLDQPPSVRALSLPRDYGVPFSPRAAAVAAQAIDGDAVVYGSSFENHPAAVEVLSAGRALWGNPPSVLRRVRNPFDLARTLRRAGFDSPVALRGPVSVSDASHRRWLLKPRASSGGHGVSAWQTGAPVPRGHYVQEFVDGTPGSVVFVAAAGRAVVLGLSRQLVGERALGGSGFRYCGSIVSPAQFDRDEDLMVTAGGLATCVAESFGLVGVGSVDFIASEGVPHPIEVNPRWTASMELMERAYGVSVFRAHAEACRRGVLPSFDARGARPGTRAIGKAVLFAREDTVAGDTRPWLEDPHVHDVPKPGERILAGEPVCTVFADGRNDAECYRGLVERAEGVYRELARNVSTIATT